MWRFIKPQVISPLICFKLMINDTAFRCNVSIPVTVIFRDGRPFKALCTDRSHRNLKRVNIEEAINEELTDLHMDTTFRGDSNKHLRACYQMLKDFQHSNGYELNQRESVDEDSVLLVTVGIILFNENLHDHFTRSIILMANEST